MGTGVPKLGGPHFTRTPAMAGPAGPVPAPMFASIIMIAMVLFSYPSKESKKNKDQQ